MAASEIVIQENVRRMMLLCMYGEARRVDRMNEDSKMAKITIWPRKHTRRETITKHIKEVKYLGSSIFLPSLLSKKSLSAVALRKHSAVI